jgi:phosphoglycerate dehydrogenase-like enzyme
VKKPRLVALAPETLFASFFDHERRLRLGGRFAWTRLPGRSLTPASRDALRSADALLTTWDSPRFGEELLRLAPRLRMIAHCGGEVKSRFAPALFSRLAITHAPGPMAPRVAELAVAFLLSSVRRLDEYRSALRRPSNRIYRLLHDRGAGDETLRDKRVGLVGFGRIGQEVVRLLRPFGPRVLVHDPYVPAALVRRCGAEPVSLDRLLRRGELVVLAAALTTRTRGLLDARRLSRLADGATIVNVARGGLVDLDALAREVRRGRLRCALDVTDPDEPLPLRHPLRRLPGAVVTPHVGAAAVAVRRHMADVLLEDLERFFRGGRVRHRVTAAMLDRMT